MDTPISKVYIYLQIFIKRKFEIKRDKVSQGIRLVIPEYYVDKSANGGIFLAFIAIYTVGRLKNPNEHPASREFFEVGQEVIKQAAKTGHLIKEFSPNRVLFPEKTIQGEGEPILTLTVWKNLQSLYRFTYSGQHMQALKNRNKWFGSLQERQPNYVVWWTDKVTDVSWKEAFKRYDFYIQNGPSPFAFDFKHVFNEFGERFELK